MSIAIRPVAPTRVPVPVLSRLRRAFWTGTAALVALAFTIALGEMLNRQSVLWLLDNQQTSRLARESRIMMMERETAVQSYIASAAGTPSPDLAAHNALRAKLDSLILVTRNHTTLEDDAVGIRSSVERWERGWAYPAIGSLQPTGTFKAKDDVAGKELFGSVKSSFDSFLAGQQKIFAQRVELITNAELGTLALILFELTLLFTSLVRLRGPAKKQAFEMLTQKNSFNVMTKRLEEADKALLSSQSDHHQSSALLEAILDNSPYAIALWDDQRRIVRVNPAAAVITGMAGGDHEGRRLDEVTSDDIAEPLDAVLEKVLLTGEPVINIPVTGAIRTAMHQERNFLCSFFRIELPGGRHGAGMVAIETTQYRDLEDQLLQSQKMEAVGRLAGGVAHDFNNMLTAIMSYSQLILAELPPHSPQCADVSEIIKAADKAALLTRKLLAFSRQQVLRPERVDLNSTIDGLRKMMERLLGRDITLTTRLAPDLWTVTADQTEIERVLTNFVLNSRDAMPDGGGLSIETSNLTIDEEYASTHADTKAGDYVMIAVTDTGAGMTREVREKVFDPFFTTKERGKGTGLGLPSVYGIVKQSGGFLWVYSELGHGTTFKVYLPRSSPVESITPRTPAYNRPVGPETILLVEDDEEVRHVAVRILTQNGYRVLEAGNGADALRICEKEGDSLDLIVTDIVMPEMGGSEFANRVRARQPAARILFTSGYTEDVAVRESFLDAGEEFIEKPFTPASLAKKTREMLDATSSEH